MQSESTKQEIKILLVSDLHYEMNLLNKLIADIQKQIDQQTIKLDYIISPGDFVNLPNSGNDTQEQVEEFQRQFQEILDALSTLQVPILYVAGNHDLPKLFDIEQIKQENTQKFFNLHGQEFTLIEDLKIIGFGGSVPAFQQGNQVWKGYPFKTEQEYEQSFSKLIRKDWESQFILLSHIGPINSCTSIHTKYPNDKVHITSGSSTLQDFVSDEVIQEKCLLNIHGHTHWGCGMQKQNQVNIINPGSLGAGTIALPKTSNYDCGNYALLTIGKNLIEQWAVKEISFKNVRF